MHVVTGSCGQLSLRARELGAMCAARSVWCWLLSATICESLRLSSRALESWWEPMHAAGSVEQLSSQAPPYAALWRSSVTHRHPSQTLIRSSFHHSLYELSRTLHFAFNTLYQLCFIPHNPLPFLFLNNGCQIVPLEVHESYFQWSCCHIFNNPLVILLDVERVHLTQSFSWERRFPGCHPYFSFCVTSTFQGVLCVQQSCVKGAPFRQSLSFKKRESETQSVADFGALARSQLNLLLPDFQLQG